MVDQKQADLEQRLARLNEILGTKCTIRDDPTESEVEEEKRKEQKATENMKKHTTSVAAPAEPWSTRPSPPQPMMQRDLVSLHLGDAGHKGMVYTAWSTMLAYPEHFIGKTNREKTKPFFAQTLQLIDWDFFYFYDLENQDVAAHLLVPTSQVESFFVQINLVLNTALRIPSGPHKKLFFIRFPSDTMPRPRYLHPHRVPSPKTGDLLPLDSISDITVTVDLITNRDKWPMALRADIELFEAMNDEDRDFWITAKARLDTAIDRSKKDAEERRRKRAAHAKQCVDKTLSLLNEKDAVLISIDFEALEGPPHPISEIGICILDTRALLGGPDAGRKAASWWPLIKAHHIRVKEYAGLRNYRHVKGCPKNFDFGRSVIVPKSGIANDVIRILRPFTSTGRHVALVGHDLSQDTRYLSKIGAKLEGPVDELDTQKVHKAWKRADMQRSLKKVLEDLGINYQYLHNAGNDAMYTLRALLAMAVRVKEEGLADEPVESSSAQDMEA